MIKVNFLFILFTIYSPIVFTQKVRDNLFLVCGDSKVLLVDYTSSIDSILTVIWSWDGHTAEGVPEEYRLKKFNSGAWKFNLNSEKFGRLNFTNAKILKSLGQNSIGTG